LVEPRGRSYGGVIGIIIIILAVVGLFALL